MALTLDDIIEFNMLNIKGTQYYIIMWMRKMELKVVQGQFIRGHSDGCTVLSAPNPSREFLKKDLQENRLLYRELFDEFCRIKDINKSTKQLELIKTKKEIRKFVADNDLVPIQRTNISKHAKPRNQIDGTDQYKSSELCNSNTSNFISKFTEIYYVVYSYEYDSRMRISNDEISIDRTINDGFTTRDIIKKIMIKVKESFNGYNRPSNLVLINFIKLN